MSLKICRSCLCESNEMKNILNIDLKLSESDKIKFIDCYTAITDVYIQDNETTSSMPTTICEKCENDLIFSYKFRLQCQKSDQELKLRFVVKTETTEEVEDIVLEPIVEINFELESSSDSEELKNASNCSDFSEEDNEEDADFESEPSLSSERKTRSRRKSRDKPISNNENISFKKALHLSIQNCEEVGDIKAVFKCIHCDEVSGFITSIRSD